ncbi:hypothetical protein BGZ73_000595 [Actinomortierella ambigua]|nr:hypothetical protein BGZ73_000595 [Actinomortierella ambigua]
MDISRAVQWYRLAARQSHTEAQERLEPIMKKRRRRFCSDHVHSPYDDPDGPDAPACSIVPRAPQHSLVDRVGTDQVFMTPVLSRDDDRDDDDDPSGPSNEPSIGDTTDPDADNLGGASSSARAQAAEESGALSALYDTHEQDGALYLVMEFAEGGNLTNAITNGRLDWPIKARITQGIARGLDYLHRKNVVHRNIKSNNILLAPGMVAKLCDVGMNSVITASRATPGGWIEGNKRWMAPELFHDLPRYSTRSDIFAFGMIMWQMAATSVMPFESHDGSQAVTLIQNGSRDEIPDDTPIEYRMMIEQCWDQDPNKRPRKGAMVWPSMQSLPVSSGGAIMSEERAIRQRDENLSRELPGAHIGVERRMTDVQGVGDSSQSGLDRFSLGNLHRSTPTHMSQPNPPIHDGFSVHILQTLIDEIRQRQLRVCALPAVCKSLADTCGEALHTAQCAPSDADHQRLAQALAGVS